MTQRTKARRRPRRGSEGFKLLEVMISMAVLLIAAVGFVRLHSSIIRGIASSEDTSVALDIAQQKVEELSAIGAAGLPQCPPDPLLGTPGCQVSAGAQQFAADLPADPGGYLCTRRVDSAQVTMVGNTPLPAGSRFRVDTVVENHPIASQLAGGQLVTVSVCWEDLSSTVRQVQTRRYLVPDA